MTGDDSEMDSKTSLALERTEMATFRTCLALDRTVLVGLSHLSMVRKLRAGEMPLPTIWPLSVTISLLLALLALGGLWSVFAR